MNHMIIGIDVSQATPEKTGIEYYNCELSKALIKFSEYKIIAFTNNRKFLNLSRETLDTPNFKLVEIPASSPNSKWGRQVAKVAKEESVDAFISTTLFTFPLFFTPTVQIVYDIQPIRFPEFWPKSATIKFRLFLKAAVWKAKKILTISEFTKTDLLDLYPRISKKVQSIGSGLHDWAKSPPTQAELTKVQEKLKLPKDYVLSVSTLQPRKNYINMIKGFAEFSKLNPQYEYLISGKKGWYYEEIFKTVKELNLENKVRFLGYTDEADFPALFSSAKALLFCSFGEGFGLPPLEAYAMGTPSVLSNIPVLKEVLEDEAIFVDEKDAASIARGIQKAISLNPIEPKPAILRKHSWENVAQKTINAIKALK